MISFVLLNKASKPPSNSSKSLLLWWYIHIYSCHNILLQQLTSRYKLLVTCCNTSDYSLAMWISYSTYGAKCGYFQWSNRNIWKIYINVFEFFNVTYLLFLILESNLQLIGICKDEKKIVRIRHIYLSIKYAIKISREYLIA